MEQMNSDVALKREVCGVMFRDFEKFSFLHHIAGSEKYEYFQWLKEKMVIKEYKAQDYLFKKGDKIKSLYFLTKGTVKFVCSCNDKHLSPYFSYAPYAMFGMEDYIYRLDEDVLLPLVDGEAFFGDVSQTTKQRRFTAQAATDVVLFKLNISKLLQEFNFKFKSISDDLFIFQLESL